MEISLGIGESQRFGPLATKKGNAVVTFADSRQHRNQQSQLQFEKSGQLFIRTHNEMLSVVAVCVSGEDSLPTSRLTQKKRQNRYSRHAVASRMRPSKVYEVA
jgi:hypothetical protein